MMKKKCKSCNKIKDIDMFRSERDGELVLKTCRVCRTRPKDLQRDICKSQLLSLVGNNF